MTSAHPPTATYSNDPENNLVDRVRLAVAEDRSDPPMSESLSANEAPEEAARAFVRAADRAHLNQGRIVEIDPHQNHRARSPVAFDTARIRKADKTRTVATAATSQVKTTPAARRPRDSRRC